MPTHRTAFVLAALLLGCLWVFMSSIPNLARKWHLNVSFASRLDDTNSSKDYISVYIYGNQTSALKKLELGIKEQSIFMAKWNDSLQEATLTSHVSEVLNSAARYQGGPVLISALLLQEETGSIRRTTNPEEADLYLVPHSYAGGSRAENPASTNAFTMDFTRYVTELATSFPLTFTSEKANRHVFYTEFPPGHHLKNPEDRICGDKRCTFEHHWGPITHWKGINLLAVEPPLSHYRFQEGSVFFPENTAIYPSPYFQSPFLTNSFFQEKLADSTLRFPWEKRKDSRKYLVCGALGRVDMFPLRQALQSSLTLCGADCMLLTDHQAFYNAFLIHQMFFNSIFCLQPVGDTATRSSTFSAMHLGCIPVFFHQYSGPNAYPFHFINGEEYSLTIDGAAILNGSVDVVEFLRTIPMETISKMQDKLAAYAMGTCYGSISESYLRSFGPTAFELSIAAIAHYTGIKLPSALAQMRSIQEIANAKPVISSSA